MGTILGLTLMLAVFAIPAGASTIAIVDTLGEATPHTRFITSGSAGQAIFAEQLVGPKFTLMERTILTEIGAFVNVDCGRGTIFPCDPRPAGPQLTVQIRPSTEGVPDPFTVIATFILSQDMVPYIYSYEFVETDLILEPGTYFALFAPQGDEAGSLLGLASTPFNYLPEAIIMGFLNPSTGRSFVSSSPLPGAVRILGTPIP